MAHRVPKRRRRRLAIALAVLTALGTPAAVLLPRTVYYLRRSADHARSERAHRAQALELCRRLLQDPDDEFVDFLKTEETRMASDHAWLKDQYSHAAPRFWERAPRDVPLPYRWDRQRDRRVLEAVLLPESDESNSSDDRAGEAPSVKRVVVDQFASTGPFDVFEIEAITSILAEKGFPAEPAADLQRRNQRAGEPLSELNLDRNRIVLDDFWQLRSDLHSKYSMDTRLVKVTLPGYSRDGTLAVVALQFYDYPHRAGAVLVVRNSEGRWRIVASESFFGE